MIEFWVDPDSPYFKDVFGQQDKKYIFHCASGWRSALTVATLQDMGFEAAHLKEGFSTWADKGGPVEQVEKKYSGAPDFCRYATGGMSHKRAKPIPLFAQVNVGSYEPSIFVIAL